MNGLFAQLASGILQLGSWETEARGDLLRGHGFALQISKGCDGMEALGIYTAAIISFPASFLQKIKGWAIGLGILGSLNLLRIVQLYLMGVYMPDWFEFLHLEVWQVIFIAIALVIWFRWQQKIFRLNHE